MGWFKDMFSGNKEEKKTLSKIVRVLSKEMDMWIRNFPNDGTPPNEEQCKELEDAKIAEILELYDARVAVAKLEAFTELVAEYKADLNDELVGMRGDLNRKFTKAVDNLEASAAIVLRECVKKLDRKERKIKSVLPIKADVISEELEELVQDLEDWIGPRYPEGVVGLDNYDDNLPEGIPSWDDFKKSVAAKEEELKGLNAAAIPAEIEVLKANTLNAVKKQIDDAIRSTMDAVKEDLSDDTFAFLAEDATVELRAELIAMAEEYGNARLSEA